MFQQRWPKDFTLTENLNERLEKIEKVHRKNRKKMKEKLPFGAFYIGTLPMPSGIVWLGMLHYTDSFSAAELRSHQLPSTP